MSSKGQITPDIFQIFSWQFVSMHITRRNFLRARRGSYLSFVIKHALFTSRNHEPYSELLRFVRGVYPNFRQASQFLYHIIFVAWHYIKQGFMFSLSFFNFLEFKCHGTPCMYMCPCRETNMFENSFYFTSHGINSHTSTQIWFFKLLWLVVACTSSSNLNYGH